MRVISRKVLKEFCAKHKDAERSLNAWYYEAKRAHWKTPMQIKAQYTKASILKNGRVVFNIGNNAYRLVVMMNYQTEIVYIRFIGTHPEYDNIDAETI